MFGKQPLNDAARATKAILTNQLAHLAPRLYVRLTGQTGRGSEPESAQDIADYFNRCFSVYRAVLERHAGDVTGWFAGKHLLEYGPGEVPSVALLMLAHGARKVRVLPSTSLTS